LRIFEKDAQRMKIETSGFCKFSPVVRSALISFALRKPNTFAQQRRYLGGSVMNQRAATTRRKEASLWRFRLPALTQIDRR
jgi:hypothetical protein